MPNSPASIDIILDQARIALGKYVQCVEEQLRSALSGGVTDPTTMLAFETAMMERARHASDACVGLAIQGIVNDVILEGNCISAVRREREPLRHAGRRDVSITLLGGSEETVNTVYLRPDLRDQPGPTRAPGRRGPAGSGIYPVLVALGISFTVTPAAANEILRSVVGTESVRVGREELSRRGLDLGHERTLRIVDHFGSRIVKQQDVWFDEWTTKPADSVVAGPLAGKRVVVAVDGGRIRIRVPKPGRPLANGHHCYEAPWVEPKALTIYTIDEGGHRDQAFPVVLDGTIGDAEAIFMRLAAYLKALGAHKAESLTVLGDGAEWIWKRANTLGALVGISEDKITQILDQYHAIEYLYETAEMGTWPSANDKDIWIGIAKADLLAGNIDTLVLSVKSIPDSSSADADEEKGPRSRFAYFENNKDRMRYAEFKARGLPLGSGAIESAIRRAVNLRLKATSKFWLRENAEHMLRMRCHLKAGRFGDLFRWSLTTACKWWRPPHDLLGRTEAESKECLYGDGRPA